MKRKTKPSLYSHIASSIIPSVSLIAVPSVASHIPQQKIRANEQWGPLASTLLRASSVDQLLIPSSTHLHSQRSVDYRQPTPRQSTGRMDASTDEDSSDEEERKQRERSSKSTIKNNKSRTASLSDIEKRLFSQKNDDEESTSTMNAAVANSIYYFDPKQSVPNESSQSSDLNATPKRTSVSIKSNNISAIVNNPLQSHASPTTPRSTNVIEDEEAKSVPGRSALNELVNRSISARSVSFKETVPDSDESSSSKVSIPISKSNPILNDQKYEQKIKDLEYRNRLLNDEVQQVRSNNQNLQKQHEELLDRLQTSQKLSQQELSDLLKQTGHEQTKNLEDLTRTLQNRCDELQRELTVLQERQTQNENQSTIRELKNENHFLKDYIHRLNSESSNYQSTHPPKTLEKQIEKEQRKFQGLPMKGPSPIWLLNQKFLAPLFLCYDEKLHEKDEFIRKLQTQLNDIDEQMKLIINENTRLHERLSRSSVSQGHDNQLSDIQQIKRQAYLVLEENKVLQDQLDLQTNRLNDVQKNQIQEVSTLTRRLLIVESEKTESDRILETIKIKNDDLKRKYEQLLMDNSHRIHIQEHIQEINEMKRLTDELSEKHANEMQILLRRVQDAESGKKISQLKLTEYRSEIERLKGEILALNKLTKKLQLRVQTYENKLQLEQIKENKLTNLIEKTNEEFEQTKIERDTYLALAKTKEEELNRTQTKFIDGTEKLNVFEERLEIYKNKTKERIATATEDLQKQHDLLKLRCLEYEQQIQQLRSLLNDKQILVNDLYAEKRHLEIDLETIWQTTTADNLRIREQIADLRISS